MSPWSTSVPADELLARPHQKDREASSGDPPRGPTSEFAPDPALPRRDALLDADAIGEHLSRVIGAADSLDVRRCTLVRAKYRVAESLRVVYRLDLGSGSSCSVTARAFPGGTSGGAARRAVETGEQGGPVRLADGSALRAVTLDPANDAVWWTFPHDRRLRGLAGLLQPGDDVSRLAAAGGAWQTSEVVEYAPERSVTLRAADANGASVAYAKAYAAGTVDVAALATRYDVVSAALDQADGAFAAPNPIGWSRARGLLVLEAMSGTRWADLDQRGPLARAALGRLGAAIATLHSVGSVGSVRGGGCKGVPVEPGQFPTFGRLRVGRVGHSAELVARARPDVAPIALRLRAQLASGPPAGEEPVLLHGDCHPKNALLDGDRIILVDLDQAGLGSPAADLGSLLARLHQDAVVNRPTGASTDVAAELGALVLDGYAEVRPLPSDASLRWHTVAAIVAERAIRAVNRVRYPALERLEDLLALAEEVHQRGVPR